MAHDKTISTPEVAKLLKVSTAQLHAWLDDGILPFDTPKPGSGYRRRFDVEDTVTAAVVATVMSVTGSTTFSRQAGESYKKNKDLHHWDIVLTIEGGQASVTWAKPGAYSTKSGKGENIAWTIIPVPKIIKKVEEMFIKKEKERMLV